MQRGMMWLTAGSYRILWVLITQQVFTVIRGKTVELDGAGASFPNQVYERWISRYKHYRSKHILLDMTYESVGSGSGKARIKGEKGPDVLFAGSDYPLSTQELLDNPDLIQFPTIAGSVVLTYNIPTIYNLTLSMETVVGIYNGTFRRWDDPKLTELNPDINLPATEITVLARSDKSGTTHAFTNCLSRYSPDWKNTYGTFAQGLDSDRNPIYWNDSFIKFFGNTNSGMSGMIVSLANSIGYMSIADATRSNIPYASIQKSPGNVVKATVESVQKAIIYANGSLEISNTPGPDSYPFASYTFFITRRLNPSSCDAMVEFVRFVEWSFYSEIPRQDTIELYFVPLDYETVDKIIENTLKAMTCQGVSIWEKYLATLSLENQEPPDTSWMIPTYGGIGVVIAVFVTLALLFGQQQFRMHKEVLNDTWKISASKIIIDKTVVEDHKKYMNPRSNQSRKVKTSVGYGECTLADQAWLEHDNVQGVFEDNVVILSETRLFKMSLKDKKIALYMRDNIKHVNVMPFLGFTLHRIYFFGVYAGSMRGTILEVLSNPKYQIHKNCVIGFIKDLAQGMKFLHKKGIVHGNLKGSSCFVDMAWQLKISGWSENKILERTFGNTVPTDTTERIADDNGAKQLLWTAPELIKFNRPPSQPGDVYSFGMVVQEMLTGDDPFSELDNMPSDIITAVVTCSLRPKFSPNTPPYIRRLLEGTWEMDPSGRPTFANICNGLKSAYPKDVSIMDSIIESFEGYVEILEQRLKETEEQKTKLKLNTKEHLNRTAPACILDKILEDGQVAPGYIDGITTIVVIISNLEDVIHRVTKEGIFNTLKHFYNGLDAELDSEDLYVVERHAGKTVYAKGLPTFNKNHAEGACLLALQIKAFCEKFNHQHLGYVKAEMKLRIGVSSSGVLSGVLSCGMPRYTAIGPCFDEATRMAMLADDNTIRLSMTTFELVQYCHKLSVKEILNKGERCFQLHESMDDGIDTIVQDIENDCYA